MSKKPKFEQNAELDALLIKAIVTGGADAFLIASFLSAQFPGGPEQAIRRMRWFTKQPDEYTLAVLTRAVGATAMRMAKGAPPTPEQIAALVGVPVENIRIVEVHHGHKAEDHPTGGKPN